VNPNNYDLFSLGKENVASLATSQPASEFPDSAESCPRDRATEANHVDAKVTISHRGRPGQSNTKSVHAQPVAIVLAAANSIPRRDCTFASVDNGRERLLRRREVQRITGLSRSTLYRLIAAKDFPSGIKVSTNAVAWLESEVDHWIARRVAETRGAQPRPKRTKGS
jgi:prophage regulatory protein